MKASFDGARNNLAMAFNRLAKTKLTVEQLDPMYELKSAIGGLLAMYHETLENCHDLSNVVILAELPGER